MKNYNNDNRFGNSQGGQRFERRGGDRSRFGSQNSGHTQMHDAVCAECGNNCKVPFVPSSGKPVYCSDCFEQRGNGDSNSRRTNFSHKRNFSPHNDRPQENYNRPQEDYSKQFAIINTKLDEILKALTPKEEKIVVEEIKSNEDTKVKKAKKKPKAKKISA